MLVNLVVKMQLTLRDKCWALQIVGYRLKYRSVVKNAHLLVLNLPQVKKAFWWEAAAFGNISI
jgi:hypothetical protein